MRTLKTFYIYFSVRVCVCAWVYVYTYAMVHMWRSANNLQEPVLSSRVDSEASASARIHWASPQPQTLSCI